MRKHNKPCLNVSVALAHIVTAGFCTVPAVAHRTPTSVLRTTFIHEKPSAAPVVLTLLHLMRMGTG
jgi:hypothetical protein